MSEGARGSFRAKKLRMFGPRGICSFLFTKYSVLFVSVRPMVSPSTSALKD
jgi:hypothetical protein